MLLCTQLGIRKPIRRKFILAVSHVLSAENTELKHCFGGQVRLEVCVKIFPHRLCAEIDVIRLHEIANDVFSFSHFSGFKIRK